MAALDDYAAEDGDRTCRCERKRSRRRGAQRTSSNKQHIQSGTARGDGLCHLDTIVKKTAGIVNSIPTPVPPMATIAAPGL